MTEFKYDPEFHAIVKVIDNREVNRISVEESELESLAFAIWVYLTDNKISKKVLDTV